MPRRTLIAVAALIALTRTASGDPPLNLHLRTPSTVHTDGGSDLRLPPGYFLDEGTHKKLDTEMKRLQDRETRLTAENRSLRGTLAGWQPGWYVVVISVVSGAALGWYASSRL